MRNTLTIILSFLEFGYKNFDEVKVTHLGFPTE